MIKAILMIEMLGRPKEHLQNSLIEHIKKMEVIKGVTVEKEAFSEPKLIDEKTGLFSSFSEVHLECERLLELLNIIFDYMPASVEITDPSHVKLSSEEASTIMNTLTGRLHRYDDIAKIMKNRENKFFQELNIAKKLLFDHGIIDKNGKIIKLPKLAKKSKEKESTKKSTNKKKSTKKKSTKKSTKKK